MMTAKTSPKIGFCGLGAMGGGMARNLAKNGFSIRGYDLYTPMVDKLVEVGGSAASSPAEAADGADFLVLMVINSAQVDEVLFDPKIGALDSLGKEATIIVCTTTAPQYQLELRKHLDESRPDIKLLDCPVSGGSIRAANGTLSIFSSGPDADLDNAKIVLEAMSDPLYRIPGGISMGSVAKMCHQHQAATNIITASEVMGLAAMAGLNTKEVFDTVVRSTGWSWMFENRGPHMLANDWLTVHSAVSIILKDVRIVTQHADSVGFPLVLANTAQQLYIAGTHQGYAKEDDAGLVRLYLAADSKDAVGKLAKASVSTSGKAGITAETIVDLLRGLHLASTRECLAFAAFVGMDLELLVDIINRGAGGSKIFEATSQSIIQGKNVTMAGVEGVEEIRQRLESGLVKSRSIHQSMPMVGAALEQMYYKSN